MDILSDALESLVNLAAAVVALVALWAGMLSPNPHVAGDVPPRGTLRRESRLRGRPRRAILRGQAAPPSPADYARESTPTRRSHGAGMPAS